MKFENQIHVNINTRHSGLIVPLSDKVGKQLGNNLNLTIGELLYWQLNQLLSNINIIRSYDEIY